MPCTDWFIVFSYLGRGDANLAAASTPTILLAQFVLLLLHLWTFMGQTFADIFEERRDAEKRRHNLPE